MNRTQNQILIDSFYDAEMSMAEQESVLVKVSLQGTIEDISMLNAICERFGTSRYSLGKELINNAVSELFSALGEKDKEALAAKADAEITEHKKNIGFTEFGEYGAAGSFVNESGHWRNRVKLPKEFGGEA